MSVKKHWCSEPIQLFLNTLSGTGERPIAPNWPTFWGWAPIEPKSCSSVRRKLGLAVGSSPTRKEPLDRSQIFPQQPFENAPPLLDKAFRTQHVYNFLLLFSLLTENQALTVFFFFLFRCSRRQALSFRTRAQTFLLSRSLQLTWLYKGHSGYWFDILC